MTNPRKSAETYTHTHTGKFCLAIISCFFIISINPTFADTQQIDIAPGANVLCNAALLGTTSGTVRLRANFVPENIDLKWYDGNNRVNTTSASNTCTYDTSINLPSNPTKTGYTFNGWKIVQDHSPIEYLKSTGTQSIDTGYIPIAGTKMEIRASFYDDVPDHTDCACGTAPRDPYGVYSYFSPLCQHVTKNVYYYFNLYHSTSMTMSYNDVIVASIAVNDENTSADIVINNETKGTQVTYNQTGYIQTPTSIRLFSSGSGANNKPVEFSKLKLYYAKIWQNGVLVRNFIPVVDLKGIPCIYDTIGNNFYYNDAYNYYDDNAYQENFIAGPAI